MVFLLRLTLYGVHTKWVFTAGGSGSDVCFSHLRKKQSLLPSLGRLWLYSGRIFWVWNKCRNGAVLQEWWEWMLKRNSASVGHQRLAAVWTQYIQFNAWVLRLCKINFVRQANISFFLPATHSIYSPCKASPCMKIVLPHVFPLCVIY